MTVQPFKPLPNIIPLFYPVSQDSAACSLSTRIREKHTKTMR
ncbi:MAG TPA: hypothetical protein VMG30_14875 [Acidobacteriota bacterium]|nr:hypothetical protein [Acidobacteriota bacterium]